MVDYLYYSFTMFPFGYFFMTSSGKSVYLGRIIYDYYFSVRKIGYNMIWHLVVKIRFYNASSKKEMHSSLSATTLLPVETKTIKFANSVDPDEAARDAHEPPYLDLHCLPSSL